MVVKVDLSARPFIITTNTSTFSTHTLVIATGADSRWLNVPGEEDLKGGGVSSCATCDVFLFSGKPVVVVGGGDTAMEDALVLARTSSVVTLIHRKDTFRASQVLQKAVLSHPKINVMWNTTVKEFKGSEGGVLTTVVAVSVEDPTKETEVTADAAFVAIGHIPNTDLFSGQMEMSDNGYIITKEGSTRCSVDGVFAAGDVADWTYRQAVTSAGSGSQAALDAERWLSEVMVASEEPEEEAEEKCHPEVKPLPCGGTLHWRHTALACIGGTLHWHALAAHCIGGTRNFETMMVEGMTARPSHSPVPTMAIQLYLVPSRTIQI